MREDVNETLDAINSMLESEESLASACLSDRGTQNRMWKFTYVAVSVYAYVVEMCVYTLHQVYIVVNVYLSVGECT